MADIGKLTARIGADTTRLRGDLARGSKMFRGFSGSVVKSIGSIVAMTGAIVGTVGLFKALKSVTKIGAEFEQSIIKAGAVMRASESEIKSLTAAARKMGEQTEWTASQAAESLTFLGMAGFSAAKAISALPGTLDLATAGGLDLGRAADIASDALTAMALPVEELSRVNDVFIGTITRSNATIETLAESFKYAAPLANAMGYSIEELSGMLGMLGKAGIRGSMAGTGLARSMLMANKIAREYGLTSSDLLDVLDGLREKGFSATQVIEKFGILAGKTAGILFNVTKETKEFQKTLTKTGGEAKTLADKVRSALIGTYRELQSTIEAVKLELFELYKEDLKVAIKDITQLIRENKNEIVAFVGVIKESVVDTIRFIGILIDAYKPVAELFEKINKINPVKILGTKLFPEKMILPQIEIVVVGDEEIAEAVQKLRDMKAALDGNAEAAERLGHTSKDVSAALNTIGKNAKESAAGLQQIDDAFSRIEESFRKLYDLGPVKITGEYVSPLDQLDIGADIERVDRMVELYRDLAASGRSTAEELQSLWGEYARQRGVQIQSESDQLLTMGVSAEIVAATMADRYRQLNDEMRDIFGEQGSWMADWAEQVSADMQNGFANTFFAWMEGEVEGLRGILEGLAKSIQQSISRIIAQKAAEKIVGAMFGVPQMAAGGMVTRPTLAMVGEAGPEMIIPLDKMRDPKFWSELTGGAGQGDIHVTQNIQTPNPSAFQDSQSLIATQLAGAVAAARRNM